MFYISEYAGINAQGAYGVVATVIYIAAAFWWMAKDKVTFSTARMLSWIGMIVPSFLTVSADPMEGGTWAIHPLSILLVPYLYFVLIPFFLFWVGATGKPSRYVTWFKSSEMPCIITVANMVGDVYGAVIFSSAASIGQIGGAGLTDGLVWVPALFTVLHAMLRSLYVFEMNKPTAAAASSSSA